MLACDTEWEVVPQGRVPRPVVLSIDGELIHAADVDGRFVRAVLEEHTVWAAAHTDLFVWANAWDAWDEVWDALDNDRVYDVLTRQRLLDIARGVFMRIHPPKPKVGKRASPYSLEGVAWRYDQHKAYGEDGWRMRYGELLYTPLGQWPTEAAEYATQDSIITAHAYAGQEAQRFALGPDVFADQHRQARKAWALHLMSQRGVPTDQAEVRRYKAKCQAELEKHNAALRAAGILRPDGTRDEKAARLRAEQAGVTERTKKGAALTRDALTGTADPVLQSYVEATHWQKMLSTYIGMMEGRDKVFGSYVELVDTGRTSMRAPSLQVLPREPGVRECFTAGEGRALISVDVDKAELVALAQIILELFGESQLADALRAGVDPHCMIGSEILGLPLDEFLRRYAAGDLATVDARQDGKPGNFGFWGGMGAATYVRYSRNSGRPITLAKAQQIRTAFRRTWNRDIRYLEWIGRLAERTSNVTQFRSQRLRGGLSYCDMANGFFQGLTADAMGEVQWELEKAARPSGPLGQLDAYPLVFIHDEDLVSCPIEHCDPVARIVQGIVQSTYQRWTPDIPVTTGAVAMVRWSKKAKRTVDNEGRLIPCDL